MQSIYHHNKCLTLFVSCRPAALAAAAVLRADEGHLPQRLAAGEGCRGHANTQMNGGEEGLWFE